MFSGNTGREFRKGVTVGNAEMIGKRQSFNGLVNAG